MSAALCSALGPVVLSWCSVALCRELERVVAENKPAIIMEDDVIIPTKNFYADLLEAVKELPQVWSCFQPVICMGSRSGLHGGRHQPGQLFTSACTAFD